MATKTQRKTTANGHGEDTEVLQSGGRVTLKEAEVRARTEDLKRMAQGEGMAIVTGLLRGVTPLLMNRRGLIMPPDLFNVQRAGHDRVLKAARMINEMNGQLDAKAYWLFEDDEKYLGMPLMNLRKCFVDGAEDRKFPYNANFNLSTKLKHAVRSDITTFPLFSDEACTQRIATYVPHDAYGRNPNKPGKVGVNVIRPAIPAPWYLPFAFRVDVHHLTAEKVQEPQPEHVELLRICIVKAGDAIGLGDWRQSCDGPMGKFELVGGLVVTPTQGQQSHEDLSLG